MRCVVLCGRLCPLWLSGVRSLSLRVSVLSCWIRPRTVLTWRFKVTCRTILLMSENEFRWWPEGWQHCETLASNTKFLVLWGRKKLEWKSASPPFLQSATERSTVYDKKGKTDKVMNEMEELRIKNNIKKLWRPESLYRIWSTWLFSFKSLFNFPLSFCPWRSWQQIVCRNHWLSHWSQFLLPSLSTSWCCHSFYIVFYSVVIHSRIHMLIHVLKLGPATEWCTLSQCEYQF